MKPLDPTYQQELDAIAESIQSSEILQKYLEEEEEEDYQSLRDTYEPQIAEIYERVALDHPLQLVSFEQALLNSKFEGVFLPKLLGYSVLRGEINSNYKYVRPQDHFKDILIAICNSSNFDYLKKRIGQTIQIGFALSSDIWITNLINTFVNKRIRYFLQGQKLDRYRILKDRIIGYKRYKNQFKNENYFTASFPHTPAELKILYSSLRDFLIHRIRFKDHNQSLKLPMQEFLNNEAFQGTREYINIMAVYGGFFEMTEEEEAFFTEIFNKVRRETPDFADLFLDYQIEALQGELKIDGQADGRISAVLDKSVDDLLTQYFTLTDIIHGKGYIHEDAIEAVRVFYNQHEGLSVVNECVRHTILGYIARLIQNLDEGSYSDFFELFKVFPSYMSIFDNQKFNQDVKDLCMGYVKKLLRKYTDKRGKDYQDIKKFVSTNFQELGFLKEKEVVELFKTRRKRRKTTA